ncbi:MAG: UvrD-helicase domain-containing protein [Chloroflexota bacterium]
MRLLKAQRDVAKANFDKKIFLDGVAGTGKTTAGIERVKQLIRDGVPADTILVFVPQAGLALPYVEALQRSRVEIGGDLQTATIGKLAFQTVELFFPLIANALEQDLPVEKPHFLSLELVQYYMTRFVEPEIERNDYFNSVTISRSRLYTQIVDNLNKAALVGFPHEQLADKLKSAWRGEVTQEYIYEDAQATATLFRELCYQYVMLDFSLQLEIFRDLWNDHSSVRDYYINQYRHLIVDNVEEDSPATHDLLRQWIPHCDSALIIYDSEAGYRRFLGADPLDADTLRNICDVEITLDNHRVMSDAMKAFQVEMAQSLDQALDTSKPKDADARDAIIYADNRYHPQMIDWATENIASLVHDDGVNPSEIVILAPFLPDALRYSLKARLDEYNVPNRSHRPSRPLRDEPATRTLLSLAKVAHPQWNMLASQFDLAFALTTSITELDLVRARLLADVLYRGGLLYPFSNIENETVQQRITFDLGNRYEKLRDWIANYQKQEPLPIDAFFSKLFGEVLSQPHFGFHDVADAANTAANLIDSARNFRQTVSRIEPHREDVSSEYVKMVDNGVIANQYIRDWETDKNTVLIAPAYTFLLSNQPVDYQFWLNVGSAGWSQRLYQPLTHPYVLSRQWQEGREWTDMDEYLANQQTLSYLTLGLIRRCRQKIYLGFSEFGEQGYEQRGPLLMAIQGMLRRLRREDEAHV